MTIQELRDVARTFEVRADPPDVASHSQTRIAGLDGIRGVAIAAVVGLHASVPFMSGGFIGVDLFFVLSGFLISRILIAEFEATGRIDFVAFYWRRFLRIIPPLLGVCVGWVLLSRIFDISLHALAKDFSVTLTFIADYTRARGGVPSYLPTTWSIAVEEQFYLIWPVVALGLMTFIRSKSSIVASLLATAVAVAVWRSYRFETAPDPMAVYDSFDARFDALCFGCALAFLNENRLKRVGQFWPVAALVLAGFIYGAVWDRPWMFFGGYSVVSISSAVLIAGAATRKFAVLEYGPLQWLGKISYSLYLWHSVPLLIVAIKGYSGFPPLATIPISMMLAVLSVRFIEQPAAKLKRLESGPVKIAASLFVPSLFLFGVFVVLPTIHK